MDYYEKYLKYKTKFLQLKNLQYGGASSEVNPIKLIEDKYKTQVFQVKCFTTGFKQHEGECWNDSIMMFFCNQDEIKEVVQRKLRFLSPDQIIELCILRNRQTLLPPKYSIKANFDKMIRYLKEYIDLIKQRFNYYYDYYNEEENKQTIPKSFSGDTSPRLGIQCAQYGKRLNFIEIFEDNGGNVFATKNLFIILSTFLLDDIELLINTKNRNKISRLNIDRIIACDNNMKGGEREHSTLFYKCGGNQYYYDNNKPTPKLFDFKAFLNLAMESTESREYRKNVFVTIYDPDLTLISDGNSHSELVFANQDNYLVLESLNLIKVNTNNSNDLKDKINCFFDLEYWDKENEDIRYNYDLFVTFINKYLSNGFDINNYFDQHGDSLLHYYYENMKRIKFLIEKGIDINLQDGKGNTILHLMFNKINMIFEKGKEFYDIVEELKLEFIEILKLPNIRIDIKNNKGELAKNICIECYSISKIEAKFCGNCGKQIKF